MTAAHRPVRARTRACPHGGLAAVVAIVLLAAAACAPAPPATEPTTTTTAPPNQQVPMEWWAVGDSLFAGYLDEPGAPAYLAGVHNVAVAGDTLVEVELDGVPQPTVRARIASEIDEHGPPQRMLVHAGVADLVARGFWGFNHPWTMFSEEIASLDAWLTGLGVEVWWVTLTPFTIWSVPALGGQAELRRWINDWMRSNLGERVIDCDPALLDDRGWWADTRFVQSFDGVHVTERGATVHAGCISDRLALAGVDLPVVLPAG